MKSKALSQKRNQSLPKNKYDKVESRYKNVKKTTFDFDQQPNKLSRISPHVFKQILQFVICNYSDAIQLMQVSHRFFLELQCTSDVYCYLSSEITTEGCLRQLRFKHLEKLLKTYTEFDHKMQCLFQYGATKMNLPDKTLDSLDLCAQVKINKNDYAPKILFRKLNFASHLYFKVMMTDIKCSMKQDTYDEIAVHIKIKSSKLQVEVNYSYKYTAQVIRNQAVQGKAFNHITDGNILFSFFENDSSLLYMIFENSTMQLMHKFWIQIKKKNCWIQKTQILANNIQNNQRSQSAQKSLIASKSTQQENSDDEDDAFIPVQQNKRSTQLPPIAQQRQQPNVLKKRKVTTFLKPKRIEQKFQYSSLKEYVQDQQDFEIMINIHTGIKGENLFYFIDTKALPHVDKNVYFQYNLKEQINLTYRFYLDNRLGMKEVVENLFLCDIIMKDRDEFRIIYLNQTSIKYNTITQHFQRMLLGKYLSLNKRTLKFQQYLESSHQLQNFLNYNYPKFDMFNSLKGKVALVTGSTSGIGLGVARRLAAQGVNLVLNGFGKPEEIAALQHDLEKEYSIKTNYQGANLRNVSEIKQMIANATKQLGPIQILVNNAGIQHIDAIQDYPEKTFEDVIAINLLAPIYATKYVIPNMKQLNWGRIINIASVHGLVASVNKSGYVAAKHGLVGFTKATALELALTGVTANAVCPGWVMTKLIEKQIQDRADKFKIPFAEAQHKLLEEKQPSCKAITVDQLGDLVTFLSSDSASEMRGSAITMDGGWTSQ